MKAAVKRAKPLKRTEVASFQELVYHHFASHGRSLPWRKTRNPYHILVSEVMLQQTQVDRVIEKYRQFTARFPDIETLARAPLHEILKVWQGLGYNRRALALKQIAGTVVEQHKGKIPCSLDALVKLPGIGKNTASAVLAFAFNHPAVFIETNIRSVFIHCFFPGRDSVSDEEILPLVSETLDTSNPRQWYSALMDYGTHLKKNHANPGRKSSHYQRQSPFNGSNRQVRGRIVRFLTQRLQSTEGKIAEQLALSPGKVRSVLLTLEKEGLLTRKGTRLAIAS